MKNFMIGLILLTALTGLFFFYQTTDIVKGEYQRICMANYPKEPEFSRCFKPYYDQKDFLQKATEVEGGVLIISLISFPFLRKKW